MLLRYYGNFLTESDNLISSSSSVTSLVTLSVQDVSFPQFFYDFFSFCLTSSVKSTKQSRDLSSIWKFLEHRAKMHVCNAKIRKRTTLQSHSLTRQIKGSIPINAHEYKTVYSNMVLYDKRRETHQNIIGEIKFGIIYVIYQSTNMRFTFVWSIKSISADLLNNVFN